jgi:hypothetical protein
MDVTEALGESQQVAIVSAGPILPVAVTPEGIFKNITKCFIDQINYPWSVNEWY